MYQVGKVFILTLIVFLISAKLPKKALEMLLLSVKLPKNVLQMYSEIWFPDRLDSEKWLSSLLSIRLN